MLQTRAHPFPRPTPARSPRGGAIVFCLAALTLSLATSATPVRGQDRSSGAVQELPTAARIHQEVRTLDTYPFSEPNPVPILVRDPRLYPYHSFEGYTDEPVPREWTVVTLENEYIKVFVLPEVGGKVWGAVVKETGHEFIYRNEVLKFRNIALRGPWTSGGIEFNFGIIGHTPSTATPVTHALVENGDGSVSCWVGAMDLPSRTHWRVEISLAPGHAYFETNVLWYNPTPLEQPYYNWMTAAAFARPDLEVSMPGNAYLQHSGEAEAWPVDHEGRFLPRYSENAFGGHKSYHVVGEMHDFFGGYYHDADYGFGHWARYEDMPGQKLWLWALSREGGIWEDLLTDTDGQYVEFQAGRLFVQYSPGAHSNPITQAGFDPLSAHRWSEIWFPLEGLGGLSQASRQGALAVHERGESLAVGVTAFRAGQDTLKVWSGEELVFATPVRLEPLRPVHLEVARNPARGYRVEVPGLDLTYVSDPSARTLARPFETDPGAWGTLPEPDQLVFQARELSKARRYTQARALLQAALAEEPWHRGALLGQGQLAYRSGLLEEGLDLANRALQIDAYDAQANYLAGLVYQALDRTADAMDALAWAARSVAFRTAANLRLAEVMLRNGEIQEARRYASLAAESDVNSIPALRILAVCERIADGGMGGPVLESLQAMDPLDPFSRAELFLASPGPDTSAGLASVLQGEFPAQVLLELVVDYTRWGLAEDAERLLGLTVGSGPGASSIQGGTPVHQAWLAWLRDDPALLQPAPASPATSLDPAFVHPYRSESIPVLEWAASRSPDWEWTYFLAMNLWAADREGEAAELLESLGAEPEFGPFYVARAHLLQQVAGVDPEEDLRRAVEVDPGYRAIHTHLIQHHQNQGSWQASLGALREARQRFPESFELDLLRVRALNHVGRHGEAIGILENIRVLPSEGGRESHRLYEQAHLLSALDALGAGDPRGARDHLLQAMEWPENLGQGRPYDPEERLPRFLLGLAYLETDMDGRGRAQLEAVVEGTDGLGSLESGPGREELEDGLDALGILALRALGRDRELRALGWSISSPEAMVHRLLAEFTHLFKGLDGAMLSRAMNRYVEVVR